MIDDRDLIRHLEEGGPDVWDRPEPPALDLAAITGADRSSTPLASSRAGRVWRVRPLVAIGSAAACMMLGAVGGATLFRGANDARTPAVAVAQSTAPATTEPVPLHTRLLTLNRFGTAAPPQAAALASVFSATDGRTVELRVKGLPVPRKGQFYEVWMLGDDKKMISLGVLRVGFTGSADVRMPLPVSLRRFPVLDISLEPGDGNPAHSGHSVLRSAAA